MIVVVMWVAIEAKSLFATSPRHTRKACSHRDDNHQRDTSKHEQVGGRDVVAWSMVSLPELGLHFVVNDLTPCRRALGKYLKVTTHSRRVIGDSSIIEVHEPLHSMKMNNVDEPSCQNQNALRISLDAGSHSPLPSFRHGASGLSEVDVIDPSLEQPGPRGVLPRKVKALRRL